MFTKGPAVEKARPIAAALRIVLAEDEVLIGELLAETLADLGHHVCAIEVTESGLVIAAARHHPDLLLVDVYLGEGNGISGIRHALRGGFIPHVIMTGAPLRLRNSAAVVLQKPFRERDLVQAMQRALWPLPTPSGTG